MKPDVIVIDAGVSRWRRLRPYHIPHAQPGQAPPVLAQLERPVRVRDTLVACGDHLDTRSIEGAMRSGQGAADAIAYDLERDATRSGQPNARLAPVSGEFLAHG